MKLNELLEKIENDIPLSYAESWDNVGLLAGRRDREVSRVYVALDASGPAIDAAIRQHCDLILTHHPLIFSPLKKVNDENFISRRVVDLIENKVSYYAMHTNFDVAVMGQLAANRLNLIKTEPLEVTVPDEENPKGIGVIGQLQEAVTLRTLAEKVKKVFNLPDVRYYGDPDLEIRKVGMCPGSGKSCDEGAYAEDCQVYITGDVDHHYGIDSVEKGMAVIDAGHHGIEHIYVDYMAHWLWEHYPELEVIMDENQSPFHVV